MTIYVGVAGASRAEPALLDQAEVLGRRLAEGGAIVVCGGGPGVMAAVCRGAQSTGGTTVGLLPGLDRAEGNPHLTIAIPTGLGQGRNLLLVRSSAALVAVGGGFGTLSEIALALRMGTPVIGLAPWPLGPVEGVDKRPGGLVSQVLVRGELRHIANLVNVRGVMAAFLLILAVL